MRPVLTAVLIVAIALLFTACDMRSLEELEAEHRGAKEAARLVPALLVGAGIATVLGWASLCFVRGWCGAVLLFVPCIGFAALFASCAFLLDTRVVSLEAEIGATRRYAGLFPSPIPYSSVPPSPISASGSLTLLSRGESAVIQTMALYLLTDSRSHIYNASSVRVILTPTPRSFPRNTVKVFSFQTKLTSCGIIGFRLEAELESPDDPLLLESVKLELGGDLIWEDHETEGLRAINEERGYEALWSTPAECSD